MKRKKEKTMTQEEKAKLIIKIIATIGAVIGVMICVTYHHSIGLAVTTVLTGVSFGFGVVVVVAIIWEIIRSLKKGRKKDL